MVDRSGIYYDASRPCDLELLISRRIKAGAADLDRVKAAIAEIKLRRLSKYNHAPMLTRAKLDLAGSADIVLVVDQTFNDASVTGSGGDEASFCRMVEAAIDENPGRLVVVKLHPETVSRAKRGYLFDQSRRENVALIAVAVNVWCLLEMSCRVYTVSSQLGFEALLADVPVSCFGMPFYAGWGLTDDRRGRPIRRAGDASREHIAAAALFDYSTYLDPQTNGALELGDVLERLAWERLALLGPG